MVLEVLVEEVLEVLQGTDSSTIIAITLPLQLMLQPIMVVTDQDSSESPMAQSQCENGMFESLLENTRKYTREYFLKTKKVVVDNLKYNCNNEILC